MGAPDEGALPETPLGAAFKAGREVFPVFLLAGCGMVLSGALLDSVSSSWRVFKEVPSLLILVPALLGLKGNLEMTLGARLGSHANEGQLKGDQFGEIVKSNLMAVQCQAIIVGAVASALAIAENYAATGEFDADQALLLASSAITAASVASFVLSLLMIGIVVAASRAGIDPDNITAPVAGMLGDFCTLGIICLVAKYFWAMNGQSGYHALYGLLLAYVAIAAVCARGAAKSEFTLEVMKYGWYPVLASMVLSNLSGPISQHSIARFKNFARFQVVMNGAGGNLGAILSSKLSTDLSLSHSELVGAHRKAPQLRGPYRMLTKKLTNECKTRSERERSDASRDSRLKLATSWVDMGQASGHHKHWMTVSVLTGSGDMVRFARLLFSLIIPGQLIFTTVIVGVATGWTALPTPLFLVCYIAGSLLQVTVLFLCARTFVVVCWRKNIDPDNAASPLVCGMGDLSGTSLMALAFAAVQHFGGEAWPGGG
eukprot:CAMPEP_0204583314 /NCGR_PEP_ID=MMETSP0661-20131031/45704_1 /ASSEMBLY_ACC=CAM_ASM_000606 /TAXON_ID=109239 /ORGANISM="Alexandrium margalefi, Strain AMGDE01CS-322" /LENGTH=485 /DNA_ID=CAMNT_0051592661 /DNA_START=46 /DNA_END=1500 /DNA_ORIENTATION=-